MRPLAPAKNRQRLIGIILAGGVILVGMILYCPWKVTEPAVGPSIRARSGAVARGAGPEYRTRTVNRWLWDPPKATAEPGSVRIAWPLLGAELGGVAALFMVFAYVANRHERHRAGSTPGRQ
jgi:hypothetical protein